MSAPLPGDEEERLAALRHYDILDTPEEESFDRISRVAAHLLGAPTALVSLVDAKRQWFKSHIGFEPTQTSRDLAFCGYTILGPKTFVVPDATKDWRFAGNQLVTGPPFIRFYAGAPLVTSDGYRLGSLCVLDDTPRPSPDEAVLARLEDLAAQVVSEMEQRRNARILKQTVDRLRLSESVIVHANDGVMITEAEPLEEPGPRILYVNDAFVEMTGHPRDQVLGRSPRFLRGEDTNLQVLKQLKRSLVQKLPVRVELMNYRPDGTTFWVELNIVPVPDETSRVTHFIAVQRDTTKRKLFEQELEAAKEKALIAERVKSNFLAMMSHEIRTPLNGIIGVTDILLDSDLPTEQRECVETIQQSSELLAKLLTDILEYSRSEVSALDARSRVFSIEKLTRDLVDSLRSAAESKGLALECKYGASVGDQVIGDPLHLRQVLANLLENSVKFTQKGEVSLSVHRQDGMFRFDVEDTGIGIPHEMQSLLFEPFVQADSSTTRKFGGVGLGLATSRRLIESMGGTIELASEPGKGSRFTVCVPLAHSPEASIQ